MKKPRKYPPRRLQYENLEKREVMTAGLTATLSTSGVLTVTGTDGADEIKFKQTNGIISVQDVIKTFTSAKVKSIVVDLKGGNDVVSLDSFTNGGNQTLAEKVTVKGGAGNELVHLGNGHDVNFSGAGNSLVVAANGTASFNGLALNFSSSILMSYSAGVLTVTGTNAGDSIKFIQNNGWMGIQGGQQWFAAATVNSIVVNLQDGNDSVSFDSIGNGCNEAITAALTVNSGTGTETVRLPNGKDVSFSGLGNKLTVTGGVARLNGVVVTFPDIVQISFANGVLTVTGKSADDALCFLQGDGWLGIYGQTQWFNASTVSAIVINLQGGNDYLSLDSLFNGCNQAITSPITVNSASGYKYVRCPNGNEAIFSGAHQLHVASSGVVTLDGNVLSWDDPEPDPDPPQTNWFDTNVQDAALRSLGHNLYTDGLINRSDIIALLQDSRDGGVIDATELADLRAVAANSTLFGSLEPVRKLVNYVVNASFANRNYQGLTLGNLAAGSTSAHLDKLVNKWFFGLDRPTASGTYRQFAGSLFVSGATYSDVHQGAVGDCYFVASLGELAFRNAAAVVSLFTVNGDGTYAVKFFNNGQAEFVTVDSFLPTNGAGQLVYATRGSHYSNSGNELWVALAEKAYAQMNEFGFIRSGMSGSGQNSYAALEGGYIYAALGHVSGQATTAFTMTSGGSSFTTFVNAYNSGKLIGFASYQTTPAGSGVVGSHAYAVVGYNAVAQTVTLFNPWGTEYGLLTLNWSQIQASFMYFDRTA